MGVEYLTLSMLDRFPSPQIRVFPHCLHVKQFEIILSIGKTGILDDGFSGLIHAGTIFTEASNQTFAITGRIKGWEMLPVIVYGNRLHKPSLQRFRPVKGEYGTGTVFHILIIRETRKLVGYLISKADFIVCSHISEGAAGIATGLAFDYGNVFTQHILLRLNDTHRPALDEKSIVNRSLLEGCSLTATPSAAIGFTLHNPGQSNQTAQSAHRTAIWFSLPVSRRISFRSFCIRLNVTYSRESPIARRYCCLAAQQSQPPSSYRLRVARWLWRARALFQFE